MAQRVSLERFAIPDGPAGDPLAADSGDLGRDSPLPEPDVQPPAGPDAPATAPSADPHTGSRAPEESTAADAARRSAEIERLAAALARIGPEIDRLAAEAREAAANRAEAALTAAMPHLARAGFAAEAAAAIRGLSDAAPGRARIEIAPEDEPALAEALAAAGACERLVLTPMRGLAPGSLHLSWAEGGAELTADALADDLIARIRRCFENATAREEPADDG